MNDINNIEYTEPKDIEKRSFEIIRTELRSLGINLGEGKGSIDRESELVVFRVIHATADFDYAGNLAFSDGAIHIIKESILSGCKIVTDTQMAKAGINKTALARFGCEVHCYMSDSDIALKAKQAGTTRAVASMDKAARLGGKPILVIGNAPTALIRICELCGSGLLTPAAVIGVPVGFVNVEASKEMLMKSGIPYIVSRGRKGGSTVAAAIVNAITYQLQ